MLKSDTLASPIQDDGFHEIQLNGKQLVFLFMAATVVSVVIFLCGVLVGRGVRAERGTALTEAALSMAPPESAPASPAVSAPPTESDPSSAVPPPPVDDLSYFNRLENQTPPAEELKPPPKVSSPASTEESPVAEVRTAAPVSRPSKGADRPTPVAAPATGQATGANAGSAWTVQIAALTVRDDADAIAKRLSSKGYAAYVLEPASGAPTVYRVKVGKFPTKREAELMATKLQKEEQFKPWVTR